MDISWLTYMREEEKVARDVYLSLNDRWNARIFKNIAASEQQHMDAIKNLLDTYSIPDPAAGKGLGEFTNPDLQKLYDDLIQQGSISKAEALRVGVVIEETDIDDLNEAIATTQHNDIRTVYGNLLQGSLNHLDAFESSLAKYKKYNRIFLKKTPIVRHLPGTVDDPFRNGKSGHWCILQNTSLHRLV